MCLSQEPDGHERDREREREVKTETGAEIVKETNRERKRDVEAPATVFQSMMMNYFDRDNQDEMLMRVCQRMQSQPD